MPSHVLTLNWTRSGDSISNSVTLTNSGEHNADITLTAGQVDKVVEVPLTATALSCFYASSDVDASLQSNNATSPTETLTITANKPVIWYTGCGLTKPFTSNVTVLYLTNSNTSSAGTVKLRFLVDASA